MSGKGNFRPGDLVRTRKYDMAAFVQVRSSGVAEVFVAATNGRKAYTPHVILGNVERVELDQFAARLLLREWRIYARPVSEGLAKIAGDLELAYLVEGV